LNRFVFAALLALAVAASGAAQEVGQLDASRSLFTVMAAINAVGYSADLSSPNNHPLRDAVRAEIAKRNPPSLAALKEFFDQHHRRTDSAELAQYVSFALTCNGPPNFAVVNMRDVDIPPDVTPMLGLSPLLAAFYKEAGVEDLWKRSQAAIDQYIARYHTPVTEAVFQVNTYLRQQTSGFRGRRFQIYIELLAGPNEIQTRSYGNEYTIVITPSPEPRIFDVRHAYLHYLLDPLATRNEEILERKKVLADHVARARALDDSFKDDFLLLATESLIKAVEARLDHKSDGAAEALQQGFILTPYFAEKLPVYEKQEESMLIYYSAMVGAIDLPKEEARLNAVEFAREAPARPVVPVAAPPPPPPLTGAEKTLDDAERLYAARDLEQAKRLYLAVLQQTDKAALHAAAYYGLARIAALQKDPETAERLFNKSLESGPDPVVKAWVLVYLGRLSMASGDRDQAAKRFQDALHVEGASPAAQQAATLGAQQSSKP
jgi:tetratricopeptide (TPR) repeat protein